MRAGSRWKRFQSRLRYWLNRSERPRLLWEEMEFHIESITQELAAQGMSEPDARAAAHRSGFTAAVPGAVAGRIRGFRLDTRFPGDLRRDFVFGKSTSAGNWNSDGAGGVRHRPARPHRAPDAWIGRFRSGVGDGRVASSVERAGQSVVWDNDRRPGDIYRGGNASYRGCGDCWVYSGLESVQDRSDGCIAVELRKANAAVKRWYFIPAPNQRRMSLPA